MVESLVLFVSVSMINLDFSSIPKSLHGVEVVAKSSNFSSCNCQNGSTTTQDALTSSAPSLVVVVEPEDFECPSCVVMKAHLKMNKVKYKTKFSKTGPYPRLQFKGQTLVGFDRDAVDTLLDIQPPEVVREVAQMVMMMEDQHGGMGHHSKMKMKTKGRGPFKALGAALFGKKMHSSHHSMSSMSHSQPMSMGSS